MTTKPPPGIDLVRLVTIPTTDQSRSLAFYESLGFEVRAESPWADGHRWIEVYPRHVDWAGSRAGETGIPWASAAESSSTPVTSRCRP
jgi:hypothetical protein